jgi:pyocin large subunit-like protein
MGLLTAKPGGTFLGNLTRAIGVNKTQVPAFAPAVASGQNSVPINQTTSAVTPINPGSGSGLNTGGSPAPARDNKDVYILGGVLLVLVLFKNQIKKLFS